MTRRAAIPVLVAVSTALAGCGGSGPEDISYSSNDMPFGKWPAQKQPDQGGSGSVNRNEDPTEDTQMTSPPTSSHLEMERADAGSDFESDSGTADSEEQRTKPVEKPSAEVGNSKAAVGSVARVTFSVLTEVQHMRLAKNDPAFDDDARGPENMGAIWISKPDGTFVRSLEVWRLNKERSRHLVAYNKACQCPKPDVIATATLNKHREHMVSWDLSSRDGTQVPEGSYTLHIEVSDYDVDNPVKPDPNAANALWAADFDTHDAPKTLMPAPAPFFTNLKLELLKP